MGRSFIVCVVQKYNIEKIEVKKSSFLSLTDIFNYVSPRCFICLYSHTHYRRFEEENNPKAAQKWMQFVLQALLSDWNKSITEPFPQH